MTKSTTEMTILDEVAIAEIEARQARCRDNKNQSRLAEASILVASNIPALCQTVRALRAEKAEQRGLTLISALINFADWLHAEGLLTVNDERERAQLVLKFFDAHSEGENYFMQAEQIMEILGKPFQETQ